MKTFEQWWDSASNSPAYTPRQVAKAAWDYQQGTIEDLLEENATLHHNCKVLLNDSDKDEKRIEELEDEAMGAFSKGYQQAKEIHLEVNGGLLDKIEHLKEQIEWHKRRAEGWRSIAIIEENL
jgi:ATP-dependent 26S proteasome regulatory subunit